MGIWRRLSGGIREHLPTVNTRRSTNKKIKLEYRGNEYTYFKGNSNYVWILDAGHGGMIDGVYQTEGKRSPKWEDGSQLFEGVSNREIVNKISRELERLNMSYVILVDTELDTPLSIRTDLANKLASDEPNKKFIYVSVHSDAWKTKTAKGWSVFTSPGETKSDIVAEEFAKKFKEVFPSERLRSDTTDGDLDKEAKFWVLRKTSMPAILTENFFMTNPYECKEILMDSEGRNKIAKLHYDAIIEVDQNRLIG